MASAIPFSLTVTPVLSSNFASNASHIGQEKEKLKLDTIRWAISFYIPPLASSNHKVSDGESSRDISSNSSHVVQVKPHRHGTQN